MLKSVALLTEGYVIPFLSISGLTGQSQEKLKKYLIDVEYEVHVKYF